MSANIERIEALFDQAVELPPEARRAFLAQACGADAALLARLQALLEAHEAGGEILPDQPRSPPADGFVAEKPGDRVGPYQLLRQIGEGGCGVVYLAEQQEPVRRRVALKVIKLGMDTKRVVARFEIERQTLALMDHPNIAKVLDAGTTQSGRPYFVMELVEGVRITDFCELNHLSPAQRIDLFMQVCRAIQHAHQKGIIHRDIKPSNVLVSVHDGVPLPKVIDFGIAKATEGRSMDATLLTTFEQFIGTPAYMSPEQAELKGLDVDTRTDIYSLGVLLYELLTGKTPFDAKELLAAGLDEMRRTIREKDPPRPSTRLTMELTKASSSKPEPPTSHQNLAVANQKPENLGGPTFVLPPRSPSNSEDNGTRWLQKTKDLIHVLRGDLDWIVMKCLEKDRTRRYETANGLAMDLGRHLKSEPVVARPPSAFYRFQKLVRRNRLVFASGAAVALALLTGTVASTREAIRARRAEQAQARLRADADIARLGEAKQRAVAEQHLYDALLREAKAKQFSGRVGQRFESLEAINKAKSIRRSTELSDAAAAALALPDVREQKHWRFPSHWAAETLCFDASFRLFACATFTGISVRQLATGKEVILLPVPDLSDDRRALLPREFDTHSRYLAAACLTRAAESRWRVWDLANNGALVLDVPSSADNDFSPDGRVVALVNPSGTVSLRELESGRDLSGFQPAGQIDLLRFSPNGKRLAALRSGSLAVQIWEAASGNLIATLLSAAHLNVLAWNPDGTLLATGGENGQVDLWDAESGQRKAHMEGHEARVSALAFSHRGDLLASSGWDRALRFWDLGGGQPLMVARSQDAPLRFSPDDLSLAYAIEGDTAVLLEVAHCTGYRRLVSLPEPPKAWSAAFSPDGRFVVAGTMSGIGIWDVLAGKEIGLLRTPNCRSARFQTVGGLAIVGSTVAGLYRWPLTDESTAAGSFLRVGPPASLADKEVFRYLALDRSGTKMLAARTNDAGPLLIDLLHHHDALTLRGHPRVEHVALDPVGHWAATGTWMGTGVNVYDASTGSLLRELPVEGSATVEFSPDGHWLATSGRQEFRLWNTETWEPLPQPVPGDGVIEVNPIAFSPDGRLVALVHDTYDIELLQVPTCERIGTLREPTLATISALTFSPDGTQLAAIGWLGQLDLWDLRQLRKELRKMDLEWKLPALAPSTQVSEPAGSVLGLDAGPFSRQELALKIARRDPKTPAYLIDLSHHFNAPLTESWYSAPAEGNDLSELPSGVRRLGGIEFDVRGLIQVGASAANGLAYPAQVAGIPIRQPCARLHFLHGAINASAAHPGDELGRYLLGYVDGRQVEIPLVVGKSLADWWSQSNDSAMSCEIAWTGSNPAARRAGRLLRLFKTTWENPFPDVPVRQVDFVSGQTTPGAPFLVAITAEP
ncbi:putative Mitogen-activated protein kinase kinase [Verrucomicrobia bacterium]|nr:putative Mitogen-activated protein kinase kinase [Verrucomicrobiota bacterium]